ncbi:LysR family transcriptional regulator [Cupriavidus basilensis]|uniref:LysR family transcriptional regulator n=1 Tax=Cupriavidus basilensis TaxID=68895 RepID=UPI0023E810D2|nr:LysR family transcriptional regulator [Cupriavidus basilensis]MDF3887330.1 LysR family transcriptional regulator [Cupriavidus basilensis]
MGRRPSIEQLRVFLAAADRQSFTLAARACHKTQAAVSMQMRQLEQMAEAKLFCRENRQLKLTASGEALYAYAMRVVALEEEAWVAIRGSAKHRLRVGVPEFYANELLPIAIRNFHATHPTVLIELVCASTTHLSGKLQSGQVDLAIGVRGAHMDGDPLFTQELRWVAHPDGPHIWQQNPIPIGLYELGSTVRAHILAALENAEADYSCVYESTSVPGILAGVNAGMVVAAVPSQAAREHLRILDRDDGLVDIEPLDIVMATSNIVAPPEARLFGEVLKQAAQRWKAVAAAAG